MLADVTITRLGPDRFRVLTGAGFLAADMGWIQANVQPDDGQVEITDVTDRLAVIGLWGPGRPRHPRGGDAGRRHECRDRGPAGA